MSYQDAVVGLSQECERQVLAVYAAYVAQAITTTEAQTLIATIIASHNSRAAALADLSLAATIMVTLGREVASTAAIPVADDVVRLEKAASTAFDVADKSPVPEAIMGRLARSEPLETAARSYNDAMKSSRHVVGWVRNVSKGSCELCEWWSRKGQIWPPDHPMPTHKGCTCTQKPIVE